ncbi:MAG: hypothetical protein LBU90_00555, partial [Bacteroidales bacterium]|nr:hypothetical protein [Bacteroidales bacterium]
NTVITVTKNADVAQAAQTLNEARDAFINSVIGMNSQPLEDAISAAQKVLSDAISTGEVGEKAGQHPQVAADD